MTASIFQCEVKVADWWSLEHEMCQPSEAVAIDATTQLTNTVATIVTS